MSWPDEDIFPDDPGDEPHIDDDYDYRPDPLKRPGNPLEEYDVGKMLRKYGQNTDLYTLSCQVSDSKYTQKRQLSKC